MRLKCYPQRVNSGTARLRRRNENKSATPRLPEVLWLELAINLMGELLATCQVELAGSRDADFHYRALLCCSLRE